MHGIRQHYLQLRFICEIKESYHLRAIDVKNNLTTTFSQPSVAID